jgi:tritrans,polycis-undecaprenyl-diphosphate synthase [geranylgeranyl-diphosphate specific]
VNAIKNIALDVLNGKIKLEHISEDYVRKYLDTSHLKSFSEPDLVIRTSGEMRISNFLLWQIAYSELYFCDVFWPDFRKIDLYRAIRAYQRRERRFGR